MISLFLTKKNSEVVPRRGDFLVPYQKETQNTLLSTRPLKRTPDSPNDRRKRPQAPQPRRPALPDGPPWVSRDAPMAFGRAATSLGSGCG